ncbi:hypothetical protein L2E82_08102 [Cichorium intybus]|uniref:Uncharacterized protein n=1 Tax=Cichorium intybus TaxID=13427 RepID=A0ACB9G513_CICIN|nr:hypothetical protein L2E82_08102 [Cichorium intybus]
MVTIPGMMISSSDGPRPIPVIAMGTASESGLLGNDDVVKSSTIIEAIKLGYRHFDTAAIYRTEKPLGEAIREALRLGLIKSRSELFITTKLWCTSADRHLVLPAINHSLQNLGLEYVDLYLIHWPIKSIQDEIKFPIPKECVATLDIKAVWAAMEECQNIGLTKSIGVSNFYPKIIQQILSFAKIQPAVNQVEMNPLWQQKKLVQFCKENNILVTAYSPLGGFGNYVWGHNRVMECDILQEIAKSKGKTVAQISLKWLYEQGVSIAVKSFNTERMKQNLDIFSWSLTKEELEKIDKIPQRRRVYLIGTMSTEPNNIMAEIDAELD